VDRYIDRHRTVGALSANGAIDMYISATCSAARTMLGLALVCLVWNNRKYSLAYRVRV
jgi:hypothetical protein